MLKVNTGKNFVHHYMLKVDTRGAFGEMKNCSKKTVQSLVEELEILKAAYFIEPKNFSKILVVKLVELQCSFHY